jgi:tetratricopeptide (TPR) repeat protein
LNEPNRDNRIEHALSRVTAIDSIILRPKLASIDEKLDSTTENGRRIALLEYQELEQLIRSSPADPLPYLQLAKIYRSQNRWKDVLRVLNAGVQFNPECEDLVETRENWILESSKQMYDEASREYANQPSKEAELHRLGCLTKLANDQLQLCRNRLIRHPDQLALELGWGEALMILGKYNEAIEHLGRAAAIPTLRAEASLKLGRCRQALGQTLEALSSYRIAAFFREPAPPRQVMLDSLMAGLALAEQVRLRDAAIQFAEKLIEVVPAEANKLQARIELIKLLPS